MYKKINSNKIELLVDFLNPIVWLISFFVLVNEVTKNENRLRDFLYDVFRLQGKKGKTKMKTNKKNFTYR